MGRTVAELEATLGAGELAEWIWLLKHEPWGHYRSDLLAQSGWVYSVIGPNSSEPNAVVRGMGWPWPGVEPAGKPEITNDQALAKLLALGGKLVKNADIS